MGQLRYPLFDTVVFGVTASITTSLFQVAQGGDSTHTKSFTNSRGAGQLPQGEKFDCDRMGAFVDSAPVDLDLGKVWMLSYIEFRVNDETVLQIPLRLASWRNAFSGVDPQASAANNPAFGLMGDGYPLDIPIHIEGGQSFRVDIFQGTALAGASVPVRIVLDGILTKP